MELKWDRDDEPEDEDLDEAERDAEVEADEDDEEGVDDDLDEDDEREAVQEGEDLAVQRTFLDAQRAGVGSKKLAQRLREPGTSPDVSAGDLDADWERADPVGEETVGGTVSTPDQDIVDEIGKAVGLTYDDAEPLDPTHKVDRRDVNKWERRLDPTTEPDYAERQRDLDSGRLDEEDEAAA
jgi:hypothetical protein